MITINDKQLLIDNPELSKEIEDKIVAKIAAEKEA